MAGIYIHIPFCKKRCIYCDFYSTTSGHLKEAYIDALEKEIDLRKDYAENEVIETIYFGGGTPSQLLPSEAERIINRIKSVHRLSRNPEITLEANPDDISEKFLDGLRNTDINRISIGIQTFNDERLKFLNRRHDSKQAVKAVGMCREYGYDNISIDLIYGFPEESGDEWEKDIDKAISLGIQHISAYHIIYEEGTRLTRMLEEGKIKEIDEDNSIRQFETLMSKLKDAGFIHYEISNFCKPGMHSRHNTSYWQNKRYIGLGASAHSYNLESRQWNVADINTYIKALNEGEKFFETENLDIYSHYNDYILTSLRTMWGADIAYIREKFGERLSEYFLKNADRYIDSGDIESRDGKYIINEKGIFISDGIMSDLMWV